MWSPEADGQDRGMPSRQKGAGRSDGPSVRSRYRPNPAACESEMARVPECRPGVGPRAVAPGYLAPWLHAMACASRSCEARSAAAGCTSSHPLDSATIPSQTSPYPHPPHALALANASLLIPLNICRHKTDYMPWKCEDERHGYEKCQYDECVFLPVQQLIISYLRRMKDLVKQKKEAAEADE